MAIQGVTRWELQVVPKIHTQREIGTFEKYIIAEVSMHCHIKVLGPILYAPISYCTSTISLYRQHIPFEVIHHFSKWGYKPPMLHPCYLILYFKYHSVYWSITAT